MPEPSVILVTMIAVLVISFMKGAFGGGFAIVGIPLLALVMDPIAAGALLAPLFVIMDIVALRYWSPSTWSKPDLAVLLPALVVGIGLGTWLLARLDGHAIAVLIGSVTLIFALRWFTGASAPQPRKRSKLRGALAGGLSGITTMVAHSGGPPLALYLLPLGLTKAVYAGTTSIFFTAGNAIKAVPWLWLGTLGTSELILMGLSLPFILIGVWLGWRVHARLDQSTMFRVIYGLLVLVSLNLIWEGAKGYFAA